VQCTGVQSRAKPAARGRWQQTHKHEGQAGGTRAGARVCAAPVQSTTHESERSRGRGLVCKPRMAGDGAQTRVRSARGGRRGRQVGPSWQGGKEIKGEMDR
jgi:hypothetical protein